MKRYLALLLAVLMCALAVALSACSSSTTANTNPTTTPTENSPTASAGTDDPTTASPTQGENKNEIFKPESEINNPVFNDLKKTPIIYDHQEAESLPSSFTLVGYDTLPAPLKSSNYKDVSCNPANAVVYMQFTNAVAQYLKSKGDTSLTPSTNFSSCFSPKFTSQYANTLTASYDILIENGCLTIGDDYFGQSFGQYQIMKNSDTYNTTSTAWKVSKEDAFKAMQYRLNRYEQVNTSYKDRLTTGIGYFDAIDTCIKITNSTNGQKFLKKVKDALVTGNVVVAQNYLDRWVYMTLDSDTGSAKSGDTVIPFATNVSTSNGTTSPYQLCVLGYDDSVTYTRGKTTMTGAFLVCNVSDDTWGTNGYAWVMYDALNGKSESESFDKDFEDLIPDKQERGLALDVFTFTYWDCDVTTEMPSLYALVELSVANRNSFTIKMSRTDVIGRSNKLTQYQTAYSSGTSATTYGVNDKKEGETENTKHWFNFSGRVDGSEGTAVYLVNMTRLLNSMPDGTSYTDFRFGIEVISTSTDSPVTLKSIRIYTADGTEVTSSVYPEGKVLNGNSSSENCIFDFSDTVKRDLSVGNYYRLMNVETGGYITRKSSVYLVAGSGAEKSGSLLFQILSKIRYGTEYNADYIPKYNILTTQNDKSTTYNRALDIAENMPGVAVKAKLQNSDGGGTVDVPGKRFFLQNWRFSYNDDGTVCIYLATETTTFALGVDADGNVVLVEVKDTLSNKVKWVMVPEFDSTIKTAYTATAEKTEGGVSVTGTASVASGKTIVDLKISVYNAEGVLVGESDTITGGKAKVALDTVVNTTATGVLRVEITGTVKVSDTTYEAPVANSYIIVR